MRKIILYMATSIDGFIAKEDGGIDWIDTNVDLGEFGFEAFLKKIDTIFMGRKSYEQLLGFGNWPYENFYTYVFSTSNFKPSTVNTEAVDNLTCDFVNSLTNKKGKSIWLFGGGKLNHFFLENDLIDEIMLFIQPVALGNGKSIFGNSTVKMKKFKRKKAYELNHGFVLLWYRQ